MFGKQKELTSIVSQRDGSHQPLPRRIRPRRRRTTRTPHTWFAGARCGRGLGAGTNLRRFSSAAVSSLCSAAVDRAATELEPDPSCLHATTHARGRRSPTASPRNLRGVRPIVRQAPRPWRTGRRAKPIGSFRPALGSLHPASLLSGWETAAAARRTGVPSVSCAVTCCVRADMS